MGPAAHVGGISVTRSASIREAYSECERITREHARNFSYGIRLLPPPKRRALSAVYALARRVDDIGDGDLPDEEKFRQLKQVRAEVHDISTDSPNPVLAAVADAGERMPLPLAAFDELIDGCEADVIGVEYRTFDDVLDYCRRVAGSVGRLSLGVFGGSDMARDALRADALGVALQLTNILRDVREDYRAGRVYLPAEDLAAFGVRLAHEVSDPDVTANDVSPAAVHPGWDAFMRYQVRRTEDWYSEGLRLLPVLDRRSRACCAAMAGIYHQVLGRIAAQPRIVLGQRTSLPTWRKASVAARSFAGMTP